MMSIQQQQQLTINEFSCAYCHQSRYKNGFFRIFKDVGIQFFCSKKCADAEKKRKKKLICPVCGKTFENRNSIKNRKYCSKACGRKVQPDWYEKFYWCNLCNKWIPQEDSRVRKKGEKNPSRYRLKKDHYFCPRCNNELRTSKKFNKEKKT